MVQVPTTVAQMLNCSTVWRRHEDRPRYTVPSTRVSKTVRTASVPPVTRDEPTDDTGQACPTCDSPANSVQPAATLINYT